MKIYKLIIIATLLLTSNWAKSETKVKISTEYGDIVVKLYNQTPKHKANFIKVINEHYYDSAIFHRVIKNFMIQCGENKSIDMKKYNYLVDAEIVDTLYHKKVCWQPLELPTK
jgi:cyclophilin family peptidyl-prolyl cis-trans isomerase